MYKMQEPPPVQELTVDGDNPAVCLGTDWIAGCAGVLSGITPSGRVDEQGAAGDGDSGVGDDGRTIFAPLDSDLRPSRQCAAQRHVSPLCGDVGGCEAHPSYCICRESRRIFFQGEKQFGNFRSYSLLKSSQEENWKGVGAGIHADQSD